MSSFLSQNQHKFNALRGILLILLQFITNELLQFLSKLFFVVYYLDYNYLIVNRCCHSAIDIKSDTKFNAN